MKKILLLSLLFQAIFANAQNIENFITQQKGGELIITYDLISSKDEFFNLDLLYAVKNNKWKSIKNKYGEFGDSIKPGKNKHIMLWVDDLKLNENEKVKFMLVAVHNAIEPRKNGSLNDSENNTYKWIRYEDTRWMVSNLKTQVDGASLTNDEILYSAHAAHNACPELWKLPSDKDWKKLERNLGMSASQVKDFGLRKANLQNFIDSGFTLNPIDYNISIYKNDDILAFWSSTHNQNYYWNSDKFFARIIKINSNEISKKLRPKTEELSIRCVQSAIFKDTLKSVKEHILQKTKLQGTFRDPFTGEKFYWQKFDDKIWLKRDITGSFTFSKISRNCPHGWRTPIKEDWEELINSFEPSINLGNKNEIISQRMSSNGNWGFDMSNNDYWMEVNYYTYETFWINKDDKEDSKKHLKFPSNEQKTISWNKKQINEKAKLRYILKNKDYINYSGNIEKGTFTDKRDDKEYSWVKIGDVKWMAENLRYITEENTECKDENPANCSAFGRMYNFKTAEEICPPGWRLPTAKEWQLLINNAKTDNISKYDIEKLYPFGITGFDLLLGGEEIINGKNTIYSANYWFLNNDEPGCYNFKSNGTITEQNSVSKRRDYFYIRCVKTR